MSSLLKLWLVFKMLAIGNHFHGYLESHLSLKFYYVGDFFLNVIIKEKISSKDQDYYSSPKGENPKVCISRAFHFISFVSL